MISCFTDYIGLRGVCDPQTPGSGLYIDDHSEVRLSHLESITDEDRDSIKAIFDAISTRALIEFEKDVRARMRGNFKNKTIAENVTTSEYQETFELTTVGAEYRGVYIEVFGSASLDLAVNYINFYATGAGSQEFKIFDAQTGTVLDTITATVTEGHNTIQVNKLYSTLPQRQHFFIAYDATSTRSYKSLTDTWHTCNVNCHLGSSELMYVSGGAVSTASQVIFANIATGNNTHGISANINLVCGVNNFICQNREALKVALWNRYAIEFLREVENTTRLNDFTLDTDRAEARVRLYGNDQRPGMFDMYYKDLDDILQDMKPQNDGVCFECDNYVKNVNWF